MRKIISYIMLNKFAVMIKPSVYLSVSRLNPCAPTSGGEPAGQAAEIVAALRARCISRGGSALRSRSAEGGGGEFDPSTVGRGRNSVRPPREEGGQGLRPSAAGGRAGCWPCRPRTAPPPPCARGTSAEGRPRRRSSSRRGARRPAAAAASAAASAA